MVAQGVHKGHHVLGLEVKLVSVTKHGLSALMVERHPGLGGVINDILIDARWGTRKLEWFTCAA